MKLFNIKLEMTIPNALSILRLLLLPVFVVLFFQSETQPEMLYWSFGVLILSGLTDFFDGIIARKCNQISDFGKILDPIADKVTQVVVVICLAIRYGKGLILLMVICLLKEIGQVVGALLLLKKGDEVRGAKWFGKVSTFVFYGAMAAIVLWPGMPEWLRAGLTGLVILLMLVSFFSYLRIFMKAKKDVSMAGQPIEDGSEASE